MLTQAAACEQLDKAVVAELASRARIDSRTTAALLELVPTINADSVLADAALRIPKRMFEGPPDPGLEELAALRLEEKLGGSVTLFYLLVALLEIPASEKRHLACGVDPSISQATWTDL